MTITDRIADIELAMDGDDPVSVVHGAEQLSALLTEVAGSEAVRVRVALCLWHHALEQHQDVAATGQTILDSSDADGLDRLWGRYWVAHARAHMNDDLESPIAAYTAILAELDDEVSAEATDLGNRAWDPQSDLWPSARFLNAYVPWAKPRFATAESRDQLVIVGRIRDHVDRLLGDDPATVIRWLDEVLSWRSATASHWRVMLRSRLAYVLFQAGTFDRAREEYLRLAEEALAADGHTDLVVTAHLQAARALARGGDPRGAIRELERIKRPRRGDDADIRRVRAQVRGELTEMLLEADPKQGDREALAFWSELKCDADLGVSYRAGLALASSWRDLEPDETMRRSTWLIEHFPTPDTPEIKTLVVMALNSRTRARSEAGDEAGAAVDAASAVELADDDVPEFVRETATRNEQALRLRRGDYTDRDDIYGVVRQLVDAADCASKAGDRKVSARDYWRAFEMANPSPDAATRLVGLGALQAWTFDLIEERQESRAAEIARLSIANGIDDGHVGTELLAQAWLHLSLAAGRLADGDTAIYALSQVSSVVGDSSVPTLVDLATQATWNRAVLLDNGRRPSEALEAYQQLINLIAPTAGVAQQRRVAKALKNSAIILRDELNRPADAATAWAEVVTRYDGHPDAELARLVGEARPHVQPHRRRGLRRRKR